MESIKIGTLSYVVNQRHCRDRRNDFSFHSLGFAFSSVGLQTKVATSLVIDFLAGISAWRFPLRRPLDMLEATSRRDSKAARTITALSHLAAHRRSPC